MSKIDELLKEYCPDGVEYKTLGDLEDSKVILLGRGKVISKKDMTEKPGNYPVYSSSASGNGIIGYYGDYLFDDERLSWSIDGGGRWFYRSGKYSVTNVSGWLKVLNKEIANTKYLYYALSGMWETLHYDYVHKAHPSVIRDEYCIPVPTLPVQQEIVRILDSFTALQDELQKELEERKSQIRLLLNSMMQFPMAEEKPIGELLSVCRGASPRPISKYIVPSGIHWIKIGDVKPGEKYITDTEQFVSQDGAKKSRLVKPGDLIMSNSMSYGRPYIMKISGCIHDGWLLVSNYEDSYTTEFLYYLLRSDRVQKQFSKKASSGTVSNLNADIVRSVQVPVPTFEEQNAIVEKLSIFDEYNTAVKKEIMFRQQQYTYYRDKLLSFPRKEV